MIDGWRSRMRVFFISTWDYSLGVHLAGQGVRGIERWMIGLSHLLGVARRTWSLLRTKSEMVIGH